MEEKAIFAPKTVKIKGGEILIRLLREEDGPQLAFEEQAQGWGTTTEKFETRMRDFAAGACIPLCAELDGKPVGYVNLYKEPGGPFAGTGWPYIVDFAVLERVRGRGVGSALMDAVEALAAETSDITELWQAFISIFFFTAVVVLCVAFITSSITSLRLTNPLKEIAETARKFGHGEYEVRVQGYEKRKDEVGELAEAFNAMADSIAKSEARRSEFVANISHELKTPMTTIAGFSDGILDGTIPPDKERAALQTISSETRRLSRLVRRMLDLSRLQSAENVTAQEQFDVSEVMLRVLVSLENKINARHLDVDTQLPDGPVLVWGDPDAITQVCYNLLDNAIKFSAEGSTMGLSITAKGGKAHVAVRNHGDTIPPTSWP